MGKESERREEIHYRIEPVRPARRQLSHVAAGVPQRFAGSALTCFTQESTGVIEPVDIVSRFRKKMRVSALSARYVKDSSADG
jgi:hypothetical protein